MRAESMNRLMFYINLGFEFGEEMVVVGELAGGAVLGTALSLLRAAFIDVIKKICVHPTHLKRCASSYGHVIELNFHRLMKVNLCICLFLS